MQKDLPEEMLEVNRQTIKWLQAFFDEKQSTISMPLRNEGLFFSVMKLLKFDKKLLKNKQKLFEKLSANPLDAINESLAHFDIADSQKEQFFTLMLTTLPGWASHVKYRTDWSDEAFYPVAKEDYLALRLVLTALIYPNAKDLLLLHKANLENANIDDLYREISQREKEYQTALVSSLKKQNNQEKTDPAKAQLVFCIDVRSEPFRRAIEKQNNYQTLGFAGFFGVPIAVNNSITGDSYASCPVLLKPAYKIEEKSHSCQEKHIEQYHNLQTFKKLYQSLKYSFTTPFALVEAVGFFSGIWMAIRNFSPNLAQKFTGKLKSCIASEYKLVPNLDSIPFDQQVSYGLNALKMMGLTENFAPLVVFCGHGSTTQNNAYATALDCGACGGHQGAPNARILAAILNNPKVRQELKSSNINISQETWFLGAQHNTTTDALEIYDYDAPKQFAPKIAALKEDLRKAQSENSFWRAVELEIKTDPKKAQNKTLLNSQDWAQVRPEWGLAKNAAFVIAPRNLTKNVDLFGRSFLHSYEWEKDSDLSSLTTILTAPMVVTQWINCQYLFSTIDNVAFGGGSKITKNITGKVGIMQGNASDLMHGLPLQSVFKNDHEPYHQAMRLNVVVNAPKSNIDQVIKKHDILQKLFGNGWINLICFDPKLKDQFKLGQDLKWQSI